MTPSSSHSSSPSLPLAEITFTYARSAGPGGQNVNKLNTKAVLRWNVAESTAIPERIRERFLRLYATRITTSGEIVLHGQRYREVERNRRDCLARLEEMLAEAAKIPKRRKATRPTRGSVERRLKRKKEQSQKKSQRRQRFD